MCTVAANGTLYTTVTDGVIMIKKVIDISKFQGAVDFKKIKKAGIDGVIIRCGYTGYGKAKTKNTDSRWEANCKAAQAAGLPFGAYYYSCAVTAEEARSEAEFVLKLLEGKNLSYPVFFDTEDNHDTVLYSPESQLSIGRKRLTQVAAEFLETLNKNGVFCGIYASKSWLENQLDMSLLSAWDVWVAQYADKLTYKGEYSMWQYTSKGTVDGIEGYVDMNCCYVDYPARLAAKTADSNILKKGDSSQAVLAYKMLLAVLKKLGVIDCAVDDNGIFGNGTHNATLALQKALGFEENGVVDDVLIISARELIAAHLTGVKSKIQTVLGAWH